MASSVHVHELTCDSPPIAQMLSASEPTDATQYLQRIPQDSVQHIKQPTNISGSSNRSIPGSVNNGRAEQPGQKSSDVNNPQIPIPQHPSSSSNPRKRPGENFTDRERLKQIRAKNDEGMKRIQESKKRIEESEKKIQEKMRALIDREEERGREVRR